MKRIVELLNLEELDVVLLQFEAISVPCQTVKSVKAESFIRAGGRICD